MKNRKSILTAAVSGILLFGLSAAAVFGPKLKYSDSERRSLAVKPALSLESLASGKFMKEFEAAAPDQFPMRDSFRMVKALSARYLFGTEDNSGLYIENGSIGKLEYPMNEARIGINSAAMSNIYKTYLADTDCRVFLSVVPDKNMFLAAPYGYPSMDYALFAEKVRDKTGFASYIDLYDLLSKEDYYDTDPHWREERLPEKAERLMSAMRKEGAEETQPVGTGAWQTETLDTPFYGAYYGQAALPFHPDNIQYLTGSGIDDCIVTSYRNGKAEAAAVYDMKKACGKDPYEMFLGGPDPLVVIENPKASSDRELVIFRDSFGSAIIPLMIPEYRKITAVDLRYLHSSLIKDYIEFDDQDVLFLYSTLTLNHTISN